MSNDISGDFFSGLSLISFSENVLCLNLADAEATVALGQKLGELMAEVHPESRILLLYGRLGAGKTTFARGFVMALPGHELAEISSPSFTLCNRYPTQPPVLHCDLYRSNGSVPEEIEEALDAEEQSLVLVEWAEYLPPEYKPPLRLDISFQVCEKRHSVVLTPYGKRATILITTLAKSIA